MNKNKILTFLLLVFFALTAFLGFYNGITGGTAEILGRTVNLWHGDIARIFTVIVLVHIYTKRKIIKNYFKKDSHAHENRGETKEK